MTAPPLLFSTAFEALLHIHSTNEPASYSLIQKLYRTAIVDGWSYFPIYRYGDVLQQIIAPSCEVVRVRNAIFTSATVRTLPYNMISDLGIFDTVYVRCRDDVTTISVHTIYTHLPSNVR